MFGEVFSDRYQECVIGFFSSILNLKKQRIVLLRCYDLLLYKLKNNKTML